ncbi:MULTISPECIES: hypothetical protein [Burkholderia]|uniref:Sensory box histidine kinase n=1 Tax=Burkholderia cepacia TaxID=292 RepID=A0AA88Z387_BURCE|nr:MULTISPECIES: hypothetical protein [Burkholderia]KGB93286.1 putative sensory box histidine kinase [Burkholderia cepacia]
MTVNASPFQARPAPHRIRPVARYAAPAALPTLDGYCMPRIADNGHGAPEHPRASQDRPPFGRTGIRERARMLDGPATIDDRPGTRFTLPMALPLHAIQQGDVLS